MDIFDCLFCLNCGNLSIAMQKVLTAEEMREVDRLTTEKYGIPSLILMENAAHAAARVITEKLGGSVEGKSVLVLCGKGNNGGDGAALARILWTMGASVEVYLFGKVEDTKGDARVNFEILDKIDPEVSFWEIDEPMNLFSKNLYQDSKVVIDAIFGTGLSRQIKGELGDFVKAFAVCQEQKDNVLLISLDIPSGLNSNLSDSIYNHFQADLTVTFTAPKVANVFPPASNFNGELHVVNIGSPPELIDNSPSKLFVSEKKDAQDWLISTRVKKDSYKKTRGTALIIAGSAEFSGAAVLAANACFSAGTGMVTVAVPNSIKEIVAQKTSDEIIVKSLEKTDILAEKVDVVAIGCGLNNEKKTHKLIRQTVENRHTPMVLDAEALNALSPFDLQGSDELPLILTPHMGEFKRLLGRETGENKIAEVRDFSVKHNLILVLKGERSLIANPDGTVVINPTGNAGVSRAGAGDTLAGIITALLAQTFATKDVNIENAFQAVVAALFLAGETGDIAAEKFSQRLLTASDVRDCLKETMEKINQ
jgi:NAD(P)H-hydrate epimerase